MNLREGILDALVDDGESINQIENYLKFSNIEYNREQIIKLLENYLEENKIIIRFPPEYQEHKILKINDIEDYWFDLTKKAYEEWQKIDN